VIDPRAIEVSSALLGGDADVGTIEIVLEHLMDDSIVPRIVAHHVVHAASIFVAIPFKGELNGWTPFLLSSLNNPPATGVNKETPGLHSLGSDSLRWRPLGMG
jgi:hypothetical protein